MRAFIKQQAIVKKKQEGILPPKAASQVNPSMKRRPSEKTDRPPKKPKVMVESTIEVKAKIKKTPTLHGSGKSKGLVTGQVPITQKPPVLLREDPQYALEQLSSIIKADDYEDLSNHATEAMGETGLFSIAQVNMPVPFRFLSNCLLTFLTLFWFLYGMLMMKGLMDYCLSYETALDRVRAKAKATMAELEELKA